MAQYLTRTGTVGDDPSSGAEVELTASFDDSAPGRFTVPSDLRRIVAIRVVAIAMADAADDTAVYGLRLRGAVGVVPTIAVYAGGVGNGGSAASEDAVAPAFEFTLPGGGIALLAGKNLEVYVVAHGTANSDVEFAVTLVMA